MVEQYSVDTLIIPVAEFTHPRVTTATGGVDYPLSYERSKTYIYIPHNNCPDFTFF